MSAEISLPGKNVLTHACILCVLVLFAPCFVHAQAVISEIMYDLVEGSDSGREWIEIHNIGTEPIDLTKWKLFENNTNHKIAGRGQLVPGGVAIIADNAAKFKSDWPSFLGIIFESAFSLSNDGETITLRDSDGKDIDSVTYSKSQGAQSGESLQRSVSGFSAGMPTAGTGIPAGGLVRMKKEIPAAKTKAKSASQAPVLGQVAAVSERDTKNIAAEPLISPSSGGGLPEIPTQKTSYLWWLAAVLLAIITAGSAVVARKAKSNEWEIVEETS